MLLTIRVTCPPGSNWQATDLGFLLAKHPGKAQVFDKVPGGKVHVFYTETTPEACTVVMALDIDSVELVRGAEGSRGGGTLDAYVNDRPYVASSFLTVAIREVFSSALKGKSKGYEALAATPLPLQCTIAALPCRKGEELIKRLFEPLGYAVTCAGYELDDQMPGWGPSDYFTVTLCAEVTLQALLTHLFVLIPVLDNNKKHYVVDDTEVTKLLRHGGSWLNTHPDRDMITKRYLGYKDGLATQALAALDAAAAEEEEPDGEAEVEGEEGAPANAEGTNAGEAAGVAEARGDQEQVIEQKLSLHARRHQAVLAVIKAAGCRSVADLGCGSGQFLELLVADPDKQFERVLGVEVSPRSLRAARKWVRKAERKAGYHQRLTNLVQGSVLYRDSLMRGYDAAVLNEVIEHLDAPKLGTFAYVVFGYARASTVVVTTPNREYNVLFEFLKPGAFRHNDHRFEWTRQEFAAWANEVAGKYGYSVTFQPVGEEHPEHGAPSQMAVFTRLGDAEPVSLGAEATPFDLMPTVEDLLSEQNLTARLAIPGSQGTTTELVSNVRVGGLNAQIAFEELNRHTVDPRWLVYIPPTMSPCATSSLPGVLEHPAEAFGYYRQSGVARVVCEEKHMGSRAVVIVARDAAVAKRRFGVDEPAAGVVYSRMGRRFFNDTALEAAFLENVRQALTASGFWESLNTDWVVLDCELMPWSAKAQGLIRNQYAAMGAAANASLPQAIAAFQQGEARGLPLGELRAKFQSRLECAKLFQQAYRRYCWDVTTLADYRLAPFHVLATEGAVHTDKDHVWHMETLKRVAQASDGMIIATPYRVVDVNDAAQCDEATRWWEELTGKGGEGMVVKPLSFVAADLTDRFLQPAVKCRGAEYLRIIYGPDYLLPHQLERLRERGLGRKRSLAEREFVLGVQALTHFVQGQPLAVVLKYAFAVLALETDTGCDPRL